MNIQLAFGLRALRGCMVGLILFSVWVFVWQPTVQPIGFFEIREDFNLFGALLWPLKRSIIRDPAYTLAVMFGWPVFFMGLMRFVRLLVAVVAKQFGAFGDGFYLPIWFITKWLARATAVTFLVAGGYMLYHSETMQNQWSEAFWIGFFAYLLPVAFLWGPVLLVFVRSRALETALFVRFFMAGRGGSGTLGGRHSVQKHLSRWRSKNSSPFAVQSDDLYMGRSTFGDSFVPQHVGIKDDAQMLTIGCAGSGKFLTSIKSNVDAYSGAVLVLDPKAEIYKACHANRGEGARLDPFNEAKKEGGKSYSPLSDVDIKSDSGRIMLTAISDGIVLEDNGENQHFRETVKILIEGAIVQNLTTEPPENQHLPFVFDKLIGLNGDGFADPEGLENMLIEMRMNPACGNLAQQASAMISEMGSRERGSLMSTLFRHLKWVGDPAMRKQLQPSDVRMADLASGKLNTVWGILPTRAMAEYSRWMRVLLNMGIRSIEARDKAPKVPVLFIIDEYPKIAPLKSISEGVATLRSAGVKFWIFVQTIVQLQQAHPKIYETFISSSSLQCYGVNDFQTAEFISKLLGEKMRAKKEGKLLEKRVGFEMPRPVLTPNEVMVELAKNSPMQIVFPHTGLPLRLTRTAFKELKVQGSRFKACPSAWQMVVNE